MRLSVDRQAFFEFNHVLFYQTLLVQSVQQWPVGDLIPLHALYDRWHWHIQKEGSARLVHHGEVVKEARSAASGSQHEGVMLLYHLIQRPLFYGPKNILSLLSENSADGLTRLLLNDLI